MNFKLRKWEISDLEDLVQFANNSKIANNMSDAFPHPYTEENGRNFINFANQGEVLRIFAIEINGKVSGGIGLHPQADIYRKNAELGYWLAEPFWGKGIISSAIQEIIEYGFQNLDIDRIFARPFARNIASQKVLEKNGFVLEAHFKSTIIKNAVYEDELVYALRKQEII